MNLSKREPKRLNISFVIVPVCSAISYAVISALPDFPIMIGNVKKCAVGKHPKSEKLGSTGQAACCARIHSRYFTGGNPSGLRV